MCVVYCCLMPVEVQTVTQRSLVRPGVSTPNFKTHSKHRLGVKCNVCNLKNFHETLSVQTEVAAIVLGE